MSRLCEIPTPSRRALLVSGGALFAWASIPKFAHAAGRDPRLVVIILRGGLDGLAAVAPVGDPDYASLHGELALSLTGDHAALPLDGFFALHPAMPAFARLYKAGEAASSPTGPASNPPASTMAATSSRQPISGPC